MYMYMCTHVMNTHTHTHKYMGILVAMVTYILHYSKPTSLFKCKGLVSNLAQYVDWWTEFRYSKIKCHLVAMDNYITIYTPPCSLSHYKIYFVHRFFYRNTLRYATCQSLYVCFEFWYLCLFAETDLICILFPYCFESDFYNKRVIIGYVFSAKLSNRTTIWC